MSPQITPHRPTKPTEGFSRKKPAEATRAPMAMRAMAMGPRERRGFAFSSAMAGGSITEVASGGRCGVQRGDEKGQRVIADSLRARSATTEETREVGAVAGPPGR